MLVFLANFGVSTPLHFLKSDSVAQLEKLIQFRNLYFVFAMSMRFW